MSMPGVIAGTLLTLHPAAGDYVNARLLGSSPEHQMVGNVIESVLQRCRAAVCATFTLMALILLSLSISAASGRRSCCGTHVPGHRSRPAFRPSPGRRARAWIANRFSRWSPRSWCLLYLFVPVGSTPLPSSFSNYHQIYYHVELRGRPDAEALEG